MRRTLTIKGIAAGALCLGFLAGAWLFLAPPQLGGSTSYAIVYGSSMEPSLHRGDLVLLRSASAYGVGDVASYRSSELGRTVLHRIVEQRGDRFVFKGDNNDFLDSSRPTAEDVIGTQWVHLPAVGNLLGWLRTPLNAAILAPAAAFFVLGGGASTATVRRRRRRGQAILPRAPALALGDERMRTLLTVLGGAVAACAVLGYLAFSRPATRVVPVAGLFEHVGSFAYSADAPRGPVYPTGSVKTGQPAFVRLVPDVAFRFAYRFSSKVSHDVGGRGRLVATLRGEHGWERRFVLQGKEFRGDRLTLAGSLDLRELLRVGKQFESFTGARSDSFGLTLDPQIEVAGEVDGKKLEERFAPALALRIDPIVLRLETNLPGDQNATSLIRKEAGSGTRAEPNRVALLGLGLSVENARRLSIVGGLLALLGALAVGLPLLRRQRGDEAGEIEATYSEWLVDVAPRHRPREVVRDVTTMEGLARLAERYDRMILHEQRDGLHYYVVEEDGVAYRYQMGEMEGRSWLGQVADIREARR